MRCLLRRPAAQRSLFARPEFLVLVVLVGLVTALTDLGLHVVLHLVVAMNLDPEVPLPGPVAGSARPDDSCVAPLLIGCFLGLIILSAGSDGQPRRQPS